MKRIQLLFYLAGLLALAGCTASPVEEIRPAGARLVEVSFAKPDLGMPEVLSRAGGAEGTEPTPLPAGSTVRIAAYLRGNVGDASQPVVFSTTAPDFEATYVVEADGSLVRCVVDDAGEKVAGDAESLVVRSGVYDFYAVSPARKLAMAAGGTYQITDIPHKEDVMISFAREVTVSESSREVKLATFRRKCALVVFNVAPSKENVLPFSQLYATRLTVSRISLAGASLAAGEDTGITPTGGEGVTDAEVVFEEDEFVPVEGDSEVADIGLNKTKGVLLPKDASPFDVEIVVQRDDKVATLRATIDMNISFDEGKRYVFTLEVKNNESLLQMTVLDWTTYSFVDTNVGGGPNDGGYPDPDINLGTGTTVTVASWQEIFWSDANVGGGGGRFRKR